MSNNEDAVTLRPGPWMDGSQAQNDGGLEPGSDFSLRSSRNLAEIHAISYALQRTGWNRKRAARLLCISYRSLMYKIRRHNIVPNRANSRA